MSKKRLTIDNAERGARRITLEGSGRHTVLPVGVDGFKSNPG